MLRRSKAISERLIRWDSGPRLRTEALDAAAAGTGYSEAVSGANLIQLTSESPEADIEPLAKQGVPAFGLLQDGRVYFNYHHTAADTLDKIVPRELRENATAMAVMGYALAAMPEPLPR